MHNNGATSFSVGIFEMRDYLHTHLVCYIHNVSAVVLFGLLQVFNCLLNNLLEFRTDVKKTSLK